MRATCLGLTQMTEADAWNYAKARWHHGGDDRGADIVFQTRADSASLHAAMQALRLQGTVIDLAFYQGGADRLRLGEEFHHNGLNLRCAQINRVPRGMAFAWDKRRLAAETVKLLAARGDEIKAQLAASHPYREWLGRTQIVLEELRDAPTKGMRSNLPLLDRQQALIEANPEGAAS